MNNMDLYNKFKIVPDYAKKNITDGRMRGKTDISPMWRIQALTEAFGPCGIGWWYEITSQRLEPGADGVVKAFVDINLYYQIDGQVSKPIPGIGGNTYVAKETKGLYVDDEAFKKALSDAISVAAKALGVGADVYMGGDVSKYDSRSQDPPRGGGSFMTNGKAVYTTPPPPAPEAAAPQAPAAVPPTDVYYRCDRCGRQLQTYTDAQGKTVSLRKHAEGSKKKFGQILCLDCIEELN